MVLAVPQRSKDNNLFAQSPKSRRILLKFQRHLFKYQPAEALTDIKALTFITAFSKRQLHLLHNQTIYVHVLFEKLHRRETRVDFQFDSV